MGTPATGHSWASIARSAEKALRLYGTGLTTKQVVSQVGYSHGTTRAVLDELSTALRPEHLVARLNPGFD
jgi:hypothetical protein